MNTQANERSPGAYPSAIPELEPSCGSWVCSRNAGERFETFSRRTAEHAATLGYRIETAAAYLGRINALLLSSNTGE